MSGISGVSLSGYYSPNTSLYAARAVRQGNAARVSGGVAAIPAAQTGTPVLPVQAVQAPPAVELDQEDMLGRLASDPAAGAARGRIQYPGGREGAVALPGQAVAQAPLAPGGAEEAARLPGTINATAQIPGAYSARDAVGDMDLPGAKNGAPGVDLPGAVPTPYDSDFPGAVQDGGEDGKSAQEVMEEGECQTCKNRKYVDGSDDPGVSFKTPTHISPDSAASAVRGHEMEHVSRNQAEARREGREVVSQSVSYHTAICPECGRVYVSGGTTQTTTADAQQAEEAGGAEKGAPATVGADRG